MKFLQEQVDDSFAKKTFAGLTNMDAYVDLLTMQLLMQLFINTKQFLRRYKEIFSGTQYQ